MATKPKKLAVLEALREQPEAVGLPELMRHLPADFAERSVRRWLAELADEGVVTKRGRKKGTRYQAESEARYYVREEPATTFSEHSQAAIAYVRQPLFRRKPVSYSVDWFNGYEPNRSRYFSPRALDELERHGRRAAEAEPAGTFARKIYKRLLIDLSYHSSRLEGNTYSLIDTERLLIEGSGAEGKLNEETVMILNHKEAIRHLVEGISRVDVSYDEICTLHYLLSDGLVPPQYSGKTRDHGVRVGASTYIPLEDNRRLERALHAIASKAAAIGNPHEQSLFLLVHIAYLQAFTDVNKRTSRLGANIPLLKNNLVPLSFNAIEKDDYASAMIAVYELNDVRPLADLYRASYLRTCQEYDATAEAVGFDEVRVRYRRERRQIVGEIILVGDALDAFVATQAEEMVPAHDRDHFMGDIREDLDEITPQRIAGLGITRQQLLHWLKTR